MTEPDRDKMTEIDVTTELTDIIYDYDDYSEKNYRKRIRIIYLKIMK